MMMELILSIFMEKQTNKNSKNSSIPSSQTDDDHLSLSKTGGKGKGKNIQNDVANNQRTKETTTIATVSSCDVCGEPLSRTPCTHHERRTKIDIVFEKVVSMLTLRSNSARHAILRSKDSSLQICTGLCNMVTE